MRPRNLDCRATVRVGGRAHKFRDYAAAHVLDREFNRIHRGMAGSGACDDTGGVEYTRVKSEWIACGRPDQISYFIWFRANCGPQSEWRPGPSVWSLVPWRGADGLVHFASRGDRVMCGSHEAAEPFEPPSTPLTCMACIRLEERVSSHSTRSRL